MSLFCCNSTFLLADCEPKDKQRLYLFIVAVQNGDFVIMMKLHTWSHVSSSMTSSSLRSSWVNWVTSVTKKRPVLLEHSNRRGWCSKTICCNLLFDKCVNLARTLKVCLQCWYNGSTSPLGTRIGSFPPQQFPEFNGLLTLRDDLLRVSLGNHGADFLCQGSLISTWALEVNSQLRFVIRFYCISSVQD